MIDTQVLIIGAGPVGLVAAARLAQMSIPFILCEAETELPEDLRASTFHPPTLDYLETLGLARPLIEQGLISPSWQVRIHETHEKAEFHLSAIKDETDHPFRLQCEQFRLCRLAFDDLTAAGADLRLGWRLASLDQTADAVKATFDCEGERQTLSAHYVIGADGARSLVRKFMDEDFEGATYPETTILATTPFAFEDHLPGLSNVNYIWWERGTFSLLRLRDWWRCSLYPEDGETIEEAMAPAGLRRKLDRIAPGAGECEIGEVRPYRVHKRLAGSFRKGRLLLAGDAAHLNSPSGGMGMNGGIHDAFALTKALKHALDHQSESMLDGYAEVRRMIVGDEILAQADKNRGRMQEVEPDARRKLFEALKRKSDSPALAQAHLLKTSMIEGVRRSEALLNA